MTSVTSEMKWRTLIQYGAQVWQDGEWQCLSRIRTNKRRTARNLLNAAREAGCIVKCACPCGVTVPLAEIEIDHRQARMNGGVSTISWLQPLRRDPCHHAKTRLDFKIRDKVRRIKEKFFGAPASTLRPSRWGYRPIPSRPMGPRPTFRVIQGGRA